MGILFISHSSADNEAAIRVRSWLHEHGWSQVFLDLDPTSGIAPGQLWQQELKAAGERCAGVLILLSPNWAASRWCQTEFLVADQLGKTILPVLIAPTPFAELPRELTGRYQIANISTPEREAEGFERLAIGLKRSGLDPKSFPWPPPNEPRRPIYRGLQSLDEQDAAIFFGRDALITKGLDTIRRIRNGSPERLFAVLGASGAGKSSFLKAGLLARLKRDEENFLVLPVVRPERAALSGKQGLAQSVACDPRQLKSATELASAIATLRAEATDRVKRYVDGGDGNRVHRPPTIILAIDQAEELFTPDNDEATHALDLIAGVARLDPDTLVVATIRSDAFTKLQEAPCLAELPLEPFSLPPLPIGAFKEVIEGPARLAHPPLVVEPMLSDRLLDDLASDDALPLLAFTLERLSARHPGGGTLTLAEYLDLGGLQGAITGAVDAAFSQARRDPNLPKSHAELEGLARAAFIPALVHLDDAEAEPQRRVERRSALPEVTQLLVRHFIDQRLLVCDRVAIEGVEVETIEVAHEAILRQWPALRAWITEERDALRALDVVRVAAAEWNRHADRASAGDSLSWLAHRGLRLEEAEALLARPAFAASFGLIGRNYLAACRDRENVERQHEQLEFARIRKLQRNIAILIAMAAVVVLLAAMGILRLLTGMAAHSSETLAAQAAKESAAQNYDRGARYALAGLTEADWPLLSNAGSNAAAELRGAALASSALIVLRGHGNQVLSAAYSGDGTRIVTASRDATARTWDAATGREIKVFRGHKEAVLSAAFSPDGRRIATASEDDTARIWDAHSAAKLVELRGHEGAVASVAFNPTGTLVATASDDHTARIWSVKSGRELVRLIGHQDRLTGVAFSPNEARVVTASADGTARVWDVITGKATLVLQGHAGVVESANFSPDGATIVTASDDATIRLWDARTGREIARFVANEGALNGAWFSADGTRIVTAARDDTARIWNLKSGRTTTTFFGHDEFVNGAAFSPDGKRIVTASDDKTARIWDADVTNRVTVLRGHDDAILSAAYSPDGRRIATASLDKTARLWWSASGQQILVLSGHEGIVETIAFSPDGTRVVSASDDKTARVWDAWTGRLLAVLRGHSDAVFGAAFSPSGKKIVTASKDATARIWNAGTAALLTILRGHSGSLYSASFSLDGKRVVTAAADNTARVWDAVSGRNLLILRGHTASVSSAVFSRDGTRIVTASRDKTARLWDAMTGRQIAVFRGHDDSVLSAEFSPDGALIATASRDNTARLWDIDTSQELAVLRGHQGTVSAAAFSPNGKQIVTASDDTTARIWNIAQITNNSNSELIEQTCNTTLANGLSAFSAQELRAAPTLDPRLNSDACHPPSVWARLRRIFMAGLSQ